MNIDEIRPAAEAGSKELSNHSLAGRFGFAAFPLAVYAASRVVVLLCAWVSATLWSTSLGDALRRWDGYWYVRIAAHGYSPTLPDIYHVSEHAFFPGFPLLVKAVSVVTRLPVRISAIVVPNLLGAVACVLLFLLVRKLVPDDAARRSVALFCFFPGSVALSMAYSESLLFVCLFAFFILLLDERYVLAGVAAAVGGLTRPNALVLIVVGAFVAVRELRRSRKWSAFAPVVLAPTGAFAFAIYLSHRTGDFWAWKYVEENGWSQQLNLHQWIDQLRQIHGASLASLTYLSSVVGAILVAFLLWLLIRWRPPVIFIVFTLLLMALSFLYPQVGFRPRFILAAFPLIIALARAIPERYFAAVVATSGGLLALYASLAMSPRLIP